MPLVRISLKRRKIPGFGRSIGEVVYRTMMDVIGVRPGDVFINLVEVRKENWSFGDGVAQYVETPVAQTEPA